MNETYKINFKSYQNNPYFTHTTATADVVTFYTTTTNNLNNKEDE
jgi:hypothetical protein